MCVCVRLYLHTTVLDLLDSYLLSLYMHNVSQGQATCYIWAHGIYLCIRAIVIFQGLG